MKVLRAKKEKKTSKNRSDFVLIKLSMVNKEIRLKFKRTTSERMC